MRFDRRVVIGVWMLTALLAALPASAQNVSVTSAEPNSGEQETLGLQVRVRGRNFAPGARAEFLLDDNSAGGVAVQSTQYVSSSELIATINIDVAAATTFFDIRVSNTSGRTGRGSDLFQVVEKGARGGACPPLPLPAGITELARLNPSPGFSSPRNLAVGMKVVSTTIGPLNRPVAMIAATSGTGVDVFFLSEAAGAIQVNQAHPHRRLTMPTTALAQNVAVGDVNADGTPDVVAADYTIASLFVGRRNANNDIYFDGPTALVSGGSTANYGRALAMGNLDSLAGDEILIGQTGLKGGKNAFLGAITIFGATVTPSSVAVSAIRTLVPSLSPALKLDDGYSRSIAVAEVTGDTFLDIVAAAPRREVGSTSDVGEVWIFPGPVSDLDANAGVSGAQPIVLRSASAAAGDAFGWKVAVGELDGVLGPAIVGTTAWGHPNVRGEVFRPPYATVTLTDDTFTFAPEPGSLSDGWSTTDVAISDLNGDGSNDLVVGAPNAAPGSACSNVGMVYVFLRDPDTTWRRLRLDPSTYNGTFNAYGWSVGFAELNGLRLLVVSEQGADVDGVDSAGQIYVYGVDNP